MIAQFLQRTAQFVFHLHAMQIHRNFNFGDWIFSEKHAMRGPDVQQFDGENIGGANQFFLGKNTRSRFAHRSAPPAHHRSDARKLGSFGGFQHAEQIQIRFVLVEISARRGSIEHQRLQIFSSRFLQPANNLNQFFFSRQHLSLFYEKSMRNISPAAGSTAAAARSSAKSAKSSSTSAKSASAPTAPASTTAA